MGRQSEGSLATEVFGWLGASSRNRKLATGILVCVTHMPDVQLDTIMWNLVRVCLHSMLLSVCQHILLMGQFIWAGMPQWGEGQKAFPAMGFDMGYSIVRHNSAQYHGACSGSDMKSKDAYLEEGVVTARHQVTWQLNVIIKPGEKDAARQHV